MQRQQTHERRSHPRAKHPTEGSWRGASGGSRCRIGDISVSGCFVFSQAMPVPGDSTIVTIALSDMDALSFSGHVVYVELGMGFSVRFQDLTQDDIATLDEIVKTLSTVKASA